MRSRVRSFNAYLGAFILILRDQANTQRATL